MPDQPDDAKPTSIHLQPVGSDHVRVVAQNEGGCYVDHYMTRQDLQDMLDNAQE